MRKIWHVSVLSSCLMMGCAMDGEDTSGADDAGVDEPGADSLGSAESALALSRGFWSWGTTNGADLDLGPAAGQTCFLAGVAGNLNAGWGWDHGGRASTAGVYVANGRWYLAGRGGLNYGNVVMNNPVNAHAVCIGTAKNRITYFDGGAGGSVNHVKVLEPVKANRQCFLARVSGYSGTWFSSAARVRLLKQNGSWVLDSANLGVSAGIPLMSAVCVDIPAGTWVGTGNWGAGNPGTVNAITLFEGAPGICALSGVSGPLKYNAWDDGAMITWPAKSPGNWTIQVKNGKTGFVTCLD